MNRREFFGLSAVAAAGLYTSVGAQEQIQKDGLFWDASDKRDWKNFKVINQKPIKDAKPADSVIYANIYTAYEAAPFAKAVAIKDGKFVYVGDEKGAKEFEGANTQKIDFKNGVIVPGFIDGHLHGHFGMKDKVLKLELRGLHTLDEIKLALKRYINEHPEAKIIQGSGWSDNLFGADDPTAAMLDDLGDKPIVLSAVSGHTDWLNSAAMRAAGIDKNTPDIKGGVITRDKDGNPLGIFKEDASSVLGPNSPIHKIIPPITQDERIKVVLALQEYLLSLGLTAFLDAGMNIDFSDEWLKIYDKLDKDGRLVIHAFGAYLVKDTPDAIAKIEKIAKEYGGKGKNFKLTNIKIFVDGVIEGRTAYLKEPYNSKPGYKGELLWDKQRLVNVVAKANELGFSVHAHSIGDGSTSFVLDVYEEAQKLSGTKDIRNAITHLQLVDEKDFARMAKLGVVAVVDPYWHFYIKEYADVLNDVIGENRQKAQYPLKSFFKAGVVTSFASDYSVTEPNTLAGIQMAVTRSIDGVTQLNPKELINVGEAFFAATICGAYQLKAGERIGSIEVGKEADLVMLDADISTMELTKLADIKVLETMIGGKSVYKLKREIKKQGAMFY